MGCPVPDPSKVFALQDECVLAAMCLFGEAQNQSLEAKMAVACVIRNRANLNLKYMGGSSWVGVILQPMQFDCFNPGDPNRKKLLRPIGFAPVSVWEQCYVAAYAVHSLRIKDITSGALFYFSRPIVVPPAAWGDVELAAQFDGLYFYRPAPKAPAIKQAA